MPANPEFLAGDVFVADAGIIRFVEIDNCCELLHFEALRVAAADFLAVGQDVVQVVGGEIEDQVSFGHVAVTVGERRRV